MDSRETVTETNLRCSFFVVGAQRSGTTLLRLMLDHHPDIALPGEAEFLVDFSEDLDRSDLQEFRSWLAVQPSFYWRKLCVDSGSGSPTELLRDIETQIAERSGKAILGLVVHNHFERLPVLWPHARYVHLFRDGRDVSRSSVKMGWYGNVWSAAHSWKASIEKWDQICRQTLPEQRLEVAYERLVASPRAVLAQVCNFLGVSYNESMLSYPSDTSYGRPDRTLASQWRKTLSAREISLVEGVIAGSLLRYGYELRNVEAYQPSFLMRWALSVQSKVATVIYRVRLFGLRLYLTDLLMRKLRLRDRRNAVLKRMLVIRATHLK